MGRGREGRRKERKEKKERRRRKREIGKRRGKVREEEVLEWVDNILVMVQLFSLLSQLHIHTSSVALRGLPNFSVTPSPPGGLPGPHHRCTIHLNFEHMEQIHDSYLESQLGRYSTK